MWVLFLHFVSVPDIPTSIWSELQTTFVQGGYWLSKLYNQKNYKRHWCGIRFNSKYKIVSFYMIFLLKFDLYFNFDHNYEPRLEMIQLDLIVKFFWQLPTTIKQIKGPLEISSNPYIDNERWMYTKPHYTKSVFWRPRYLATGIISLVKATFTNET